VAARNIADSAQPGEFAGNLRRQRVPRIGGDLGTQHRGEFGDGGAAVDQVPGAATPEQGRSGFLV